MRSYGLGMAGLVVIANLTLVGQAEIWFGTWKLNPAKSTYVTDPSPPPGQRTITRVEPWEGGLMYRTEIVTVRGEVRHTEWTARFDGKDYPATGPMWPAGWTCLVTKSGARGIDLTWKKDGKDMYKSTLAASASGRVLTETGSAAGVNEKFVVIYEKH